MRIYQPGQNIVEYILPILLLVVVAGVFIWGPNLGTSIQSGMTGAVKGNNQNGVVQVTSMGMLATPYNTQTMRLTLQNGNSVEITGVPTNLAQALETSGTSGTTDALADIIQQTAEKLKNDLEPEEYNALIELSQRAHRIASQEKILEDHMATLKLAEKFPMDPSLNGRDNADLIKNGREPALKDITVNDIDGNPMTLKDLGDRLGFLGPYPQEIPALYQEKTVPTGSGSDLEYFLKQYQVAKDLGALDDPAVSSLITSLVGRISVMSDYTESEYTPQEIGVDFTNRGDALSICNTAGGDSSSGISCI